MADVSGGNIGGPSISVSNGVLGTPQTISISDSDGDAVTIAAYSSTGDFLTYVCSDYTGETLSYTPPLEWAKLNTTGRYVYITYKVKDTYTSGVQVTYYIPITVKPTISTFSITDVDGHLETYGAYVKGESAINISLLL